MSGQGGAVGERGPLLSRPHALCRVTTSFAFVRRRGDLSQRPEFGFGGHVRPLGGAAGALLRPRARGARPLQHSERDAQSGGAPRRVRRHVHGSPVHGGILKVQLVESSIGVAAAVLSERQTAGVWGGRWDRPGQTKHTSGFSVQGYEFDSNTHKQNALHIRPRPLTSALWSQFPQPKQNQQPISSCSHDQ